MKIILFGAGTFGEKAISYFGQENIFCFCDNNVGGGYGVGNISVCGKMVISFDELKKIHKDYVIVISTGADFVEEISRQLDMAGIEDYLIYYVLIRNDIKADELLRQFETEGKDRTFKNYYKMLARWTDMKLDYLKRHADVRYLKPATGELRKSQLKILEVAEDFFDFVKETEITPFLNAGSLLGAYRNQGFIPWDDDLDFSIMRKDYDRLIEFAKEKCKVGVCVGEMWYDASGEIMPWTELFAKYPERFVLAVYARMVQVYRSDYGRDYDGERKHIMDLFPYDYYKDEYDHAEHRRWLQYLNNKVTDYIDEKEKAAFLRKEWESCPMIVKEGAADHIFPGIDCLGGYVASTKRDINHWIPREEIFPLKKVPFEDTEFYVPNHMEYLLGLIYGDYMSVPYDVGDPRHGKCLE